jgi:hypothetical protein
MTRECRLLSRFQILDLEVPHRKYCTPRLFEQKACPRQRTFHQFFITELGHDEPTILLTNDKRVTAAQLMTRCAKREWACGCRTTLLHDALSSSVGIKVDYDMALLVLASGLYRLIAKRMRGYGDA